VVLTALLAEAEPAGFAGSAGSSFASIFALISASVFFQSVPASVLASAFLETALRTTGRGLGSGTFALVEASAANAANPMASAKPVAATQDRPVDRAINRKAVPPLNWVTAFLRGESSLAVS
jgi:hypothetical protein